MDRGESETEEKMQHNSSGLVECWYVKLSSVYLF